MTKNSSYLYHYIIAKNIIGKTNYLLCQFREELTSLSHINTMPKIERNHIY